MNDTGNKNRAVESECGPFHQSQLRGAQSIVFTKAPYLLSAASVAGSKEAQGPLGKCFDLTNEDDLFGAETWEEAESNMQKEACVLALGKSHVDPKSVRYLFGGDLLRQGIATSMGVEDPENCDKWYRLQPEPYMPPCSANPSSQSPRSSLS